MSVDNLPSETPLPLADEDLRHGIELLFFAYRDFTSDADAILAEHGFGRAHHRVIHFVGRHPRISVAELLAILRITKQSLGRVLGQLVDQGLIAQATGTRDRRQRLLTLTASGASLERRLSEPQRARVARAYGEAGAKAVAAYHRVLLGLIDASDREAVLKSIDEA